MAKTNQCWKTAVHFPHIWSYNGETFWCPGIEPPPPPKPHPGGPKD